MSYHKTITINQYEIIDKGWHKPFEFEGKQYQADFNTFALFDFLQFFSNLIHKEGNHLKVDDDGFIWINYNYIRENNPLCSFTNNQYINKHLFILQHFKLIVVKKDKYNNIYFKFGENFCEGQDIKSEYEIQKSVKYQHIQEQKDEHSQARLIAKNLFKWRGDEAQFTHDDFSEWLEYLKGIGFKINEISAKRHFEELLRLGENAKKAIDNSIFKGLKYPTLPYENTQAQGQSQGATQGTNQKPRYYTAKEIADGVAPDIINAGITLRYNPKLLNSKIGNNDYESEFWGIVRAYDLNSYELRTNYKDFSIDREQREYINEAILQRIEFLKKKHPI